MYVANRNSSTVTQLLQVANHAVRTHRTQRAVLSLVRPGQRLPEELRLELDRASRAIWYLRRGPGRLVRIPRTEAGSLLGQSAGDDRTALYFE